MLIYRCRGKEGDTMVIGAKKPIKFWENLSI